ncbi:acyl-CoA synthetase FdrA [Vagococcus sp. BWB3-3]|uniref:Acyl-CoA synthetase FdrA n=1 Tax=Vagococcus allomyrinae TaxID=2794353 RepID=A0A940P4B8_9ENTE|nr:acyl-CoA synthetase FdrA [Vagococcus allomyrinae]MBP1040790.1 acyl-CoA synthetase FdrA [Vagococcus allomyrinae]
MLQTIIMKNSYQDSVVLMLLTSKLSQLASVKRVSIMMGTPANKDILVSGGFDTPEMGAATANDMLVMLEVMSQEDTQEILDLIDSELNSQKESTGDIKETINTWDKALKALPDANVALISIPGVYAALEIEKALDHNLHAFVFSDNVAIEDEARLKQKAHDKGLLVMGPDCGTGVIHSLPLAFTNNIRPGTIGVVGASGTGIQEVTTLIHRYGQGVTNAIGTGGRDLSTEVGAVSMIDSIIALNESADTDVIVVISKPPAKEVATMVLDVLRKLSKPVVTLFLGSNPRSHEENLYHAYTLEEAAQLATKISLNQTVEYTPAAAKEVGRGTADGIKGLYSGGTLAYEAAFLLQDALKLPETSHAEGFIMQNGPHEIMDLGDDVYTNGRPHPMIDPDVRVTELNKVLEQPEIGVVMLDVVLGYGAHDDMATALAKPIQAVKTKLQEQNRHVIFVGVIVGTDADKQGYESQIEILEEAGVVVCQNNVQMIRTALAATGHSLTFAEKNITEKISSPLTHLPRASEKVTTLLGIKPKVINIGLQSFTESITDNGGEVAHFDWRPSAGGDVALQKTLYFLNNFQFASKGEN